MASRRPQAVPRVLPAVLTGSATVIFALSFLTPSDAADHGRGKSQGWYDATDPGSYHVAAGQPGRIPHQASRSNSPRAAANPKDSLPSYCVQAAVAGSVTGVPGVIGGRPVICGKDTAPAVTPQQLAQAAWKDLDLPIPTVRTAPPRGAEGLVGLPEWVWVPRGQWRSLPRKASAGAVWAEVTATPKQMVIEPGPGLPAVRCPGPGTAYDPVKPASGQHTDCSFTYRRSSAAEPGAVYRVKVTVVWGGAWVGSGGAGGTLPDISRSTTFGLKVAEAQGLFGGEAGR